VIGPLTAAPLSGNGYGEVWVGLVGGCLVASALALSLRRMLTPEQDGRPAAQPRPQAASAV
jgi:hypothetical protein